MKAILFCLWVCEDEATLTLNGFVGDLACARVGKVLLGELVALHGLALPFNLFSLVDSASGAGVGRTPFEGVGAVLEAHELWLMACGAETVTDVVHHRIEQLPRLLVTNISIIVYNLVPISRRVLHRINLRSNGYQYLKLVDR